MGRASLRVVWVTLAVMLGVTWADDARPSSAGEPVYVWAVDPAHSSIVFRTGHWGVVDVIGWFEGYDVSVRSSRLDFSDAVIEARIDPASVRMPNPDMASNLREHFFDVDAFPEVVFRSTNIETTTVKGTFKLTGALTMKSVTKTIVFDGRFNGYGTPPQGAPGFTLEGNINRLDFGVGNMERMQGTGHPMVDAEVSITCNIRLDYVRTDGLR